MFHKRAKIITIILSIFLCGSMFAKYQTFFFDSKEENHSNLVLDKSVSITSEKSFSSPKSLKVIGENKIAQYAVQIKRTPVKPKEKLGFSFLFRADKSIRNSIIVCFFTDAAGKVIKEERARIVVSAPTTLVYSGAYWDRLQKIFTAPDDNKVKFANLYIRLVNMPVTETVYIDNIRFGSLEEDNSFFCDSFKTDFFRLKWNRRTPFQERFITRGTGKIIHDWQRARVEESCFAATGSSSLRQSPLVIRAIKVEPGNIYDFSFSYINNKYASRFTQIGCVFLDENSKIIGGQGSMIKSSIDWNKYYLAIKPPEKAAYMDIYLKFYGATKEMELRLDEFEFKKSLPRVEMDYEIDPEKRLLSGVIKTYSISAEMVSRTVTLYDSEDKKILSIIPDEKDKFSIDLSKLPDMEYKLQFSGKCKDGKELKSAFKSFHNYNKRPWEGNTIGVLQDRDNPPVPWTPMTFDPKTNTISCWNYIFTFGKGNRIKSIVSKKAGKLFKSLPHLTLNGAAIEDGSFSASAPQAVSVSPNHVTLKSMISGREVDIAVTTRVEFDGFMKYTLELKPKASVTIDDFSLQYQPAKTEYISASNSSWEGYVIKNLREEKKLEYKIFYPMTWIGSIESGVYWYAEKLYPASTIMPKICQTFRNDAETTVSLVCKPLKLQPGKPFVFEYAFGFTPSRPVRKEARNIRFRAGSYANFQSLWHREMFAPMAGFPWAEGKCAVALKKNILSFNIKNVGIYQIPLYAISRLPQWSYFKKQWANTPERTYNNIYDEYQLNSIDIEKAKSWVELYLESFKRFFHDFPFNAMYFDCTSAYLHKTSNDESVYRIFAVRDYFKRIYTEMRRQKPDSWFFLHAGATIYGVASPFADIVLTGEHFRKHCLVNNYYLEFTDMDLFRAQTCMQTGGARMFYPQFTNPRQVVDPEITTHTLGMVLIHNQLLYPNYVEPGITNSVRSKKYSFIDAGGKDNWEFYPYWKNNPFGVKSDNSKVQFSIYSNDKGLLLVCLNTTKEEQVFKLSASNDVSRNVLVFNPLTDSSEKVKWDSLIKLRPYMFKMILLSDKFKW
jgi:hypothetical protein